MPQRIKGTQARSGGTRTAILNAVGRLWADRRFDAITVSDIAAEAGVAKGSVLAHFSEKQAILAHFLAQALDRQSEALAANEEFARDPDSLAAAFAPLLGYLLADKALLRLLTSEGDSEQCSAVLDPALERLRLVLLHGFARAQRNDPPLCADVLVALVVHVVVSGHAEDAGAAVGDLTRLAAILYR
jgi:AcrR family transcriptional regulator